MAIHVTEELVASQLQDHAHQATRLNCNSKIESQEKQIAIRLSRDPAVWSSFVNEGSIHTVNGAVTRGNVGRGSKTTGLGRVDLSSVFDEMGGG